MDGWMNEGKARPWRSGEGAERMNFPVFPRCWPVRIQHPRACLGQLVFMPQETLVRIGGSSPH